MFSTLVLLESWLRFFAVVDIDVIVKFALLELQHGSRERAKTMFENLLANYPKRTDLLHMYASQLIKAKEPAPDIRFVRMHLIVSSLVQLIDWSS